MIISRDKVRSFRVLFLFMRKIVAILEVTSLIKGSRGSPSTNTWALIFTRHTCMNGKRKTHPREAQELPNE